MAGIKGSDRRKRTKYGPNCDPKDILSGTNRAGEVFNRLTILGPTYRYRQCNGIPRRYVVCGCSCGNTCTVRLSDLTLGVRGSCGCVRWEKWRKRIDDAMRDCRDGDKYRCSVCREFKLPTEFYKSASRISGHVSECKPCSVAKQRYHEYGVTQEQYEELKSSQNHCCAICNKKTKLVIDHCHDTGIVRGMRS